MQLHSPCVESQSIKGDWQRLEGMQEVATDEGVKAGVHTRRVHYRSLKGEAVQALIKCLWDSCAAGPEHRQLFRKAYLTVGAEQVPAATCTT